MLLLLLMRRRADRQLLLLLITLGYNDGGSSCCLGMQPLHAQLFQLSHKGTLLMLLLLLPASTQFSLVGG
jgi:hypothetical protein